MKYCIDKPCCEEFKQNAKMDKVWLGEPDGSLVLASDYFCHYCGYHFHFNRKTGQQM